MNLLNASPEESMKDMKNGVFKTAIVGVGTVGTYIAAEFLKAVPSVFYVLM